MPVTSVFLVVVTNDDLADCVQLIKDVTRRAASSECLDIVALSSSFVMPTCFLGLVGVLSC